MTIYPDTSAIVALFKPEVHSPRAVTVLGDRATRVRIADLAVAELSAAMAAVYRDRPNAAEDFAAYLGPIDAWIVSSGPLIATEAADLRTAILWVRRLDLRLRAPDALHLAICRRVGATLLTFDKRQASAAATLGIALAA